MYQLEEMDRIIEGLRRLTAIHLEAAAILHGIARECGEEFSLGWGSTAAAALPGNGTPLEPPVSQLPLVDADTLAVHWKGKTCFLGKTLAFKLFARLARRPNHFLSHDLLLDEVWECRVTKEAMRSVVKVLKQKLRQAGMEDLAAAIDGRRRECYGLILNRVA